MSKTFRSNTDDRKEFRNRQNLEKSKQLRQTRKAKRRTDRNTE